ncbi:MAG: septum formation initiator family protein [Bacillota bacterium]|nr:septum formation initiator family protein [Bacillota bacterium]MDW7683063.1 septum formation initiator family protein [Bacillota bacterium]
MKAAPIRQNKKLAYLPTAKQAIPVRKRLVSGLVLLIVLYFTFLFATQYWRLVQLRSTLESIEHDIQVVRQQNEKMLREIERMNSPAYLEEMARQELGMVRSGELLFFFRDSDKPFPRNP